MSLVAASPMRIRVMGLQYNTAGPGGTTVVNAPSAADLALTPSWLRRAYPTGNLIASQTSAASSNAWPFSCNQANTQLAALRATEIANGTVDARTHYLGLVSVAGGYMRGCAAGVPGTVASSPAGSPSAPRGRSTSRAIPTGALPTGMAVTSSRTTSGARTPGSVTAIARMTAAFRIPTAS